MVNRLKILKIYCMSTVIEFMSVMFITFEASRDINSPNSLISYVHKTK